MKVGGDIQSVCRKCGVTWHIVVAIADGRIAKVECGDCSGRHAFRSPVAKASRAGASRGSAVTVRAAARSKSPIVEADPNRPIRPFRLSDTYDVGDRISHASFGEGVVQSVIGPTKIEILFGEGSKVLAHGRGKR